MKTKQKKEKRWYISPSVHVICLNNELPLLVASPDVDYTKKEGKEQNSNVSINENTEVDGEYDLE